MTTYLLFVDAKHISWHGHFVALQDEEGRPHREHQIERHGPTVPRQCGHYPVGDYLGSNRARMFETIGYSPPWVSYITIDEDQPVGGCAFIGAPKDGEVEIAYFTLEGFEGRGYALSASNKLRGALAGRRLQQLPQACKARLAPLHPAGERGSLRGRRLGHNARDERCITIKPGRFEPLA